MLTSPVVAAAVIIGLVGLVTVVVVIILKSTGKKEKTERKDRNTVLKEANRQLAQNPKDHRALLAISDLYFDEKNWEKAFRTYRILIDLCATNSSIEEWYVTMRYGLCAIQLKQYGEAYKALAIARTLKEDAFEVNYNLGFLEYKRGNTERAVQLLQFAGEDQPEHLGTRRYLGRSYFRLKKFKDSLRILRSVVDVDPEDKESLLFVAQSYYELGQNDQALVIFSHLRPDPQLGPHASLYSGTIRVKKREYEKAAMDFEIGLRHQEVKQEVILELRYRLAEVYMKQQEIGKALQQFNEINAINPSYKDVASQISRNRELHSNRNLKTFLISPSSEFVTLCRRMVMGFHANAKVKITDVSVVKSEYADILAEVETAKWEDVILFRFVRGTGLVGELVLREMNARIKELRAGRGYCITAGDFTDSAHGYVEARLIDLLNKDDLLKILNRLD